VGPEANLGATDDIIHNVVAKTAPPALTHRLNITNEKNPVIPEVTDEDTVRIIPVSGVEEIGRNMNIIETKDDIIVIDAGFQFVSEESNAPGINYILTQHSIS
jgi:predicted metal-dependent RNase